MRHIILILILIYCNNSFGQKFNNEVVCSTDTFIIEPHQSMKTVMNEDTIIKIEPYRAVKCTTRSDFGLRVGIGLASYYHNEEMKEWIGNYIGPDLSFTLTIDKVNIGIRFKPTTQKPLTNLEFDGQTLPNEADLNLIKIDYYVGYSLDFENNFSLEPYIGYNRSTFLVINEDELNQEFTFDKTGGAIIGATINKYFETKTDEYISVFGTVGYGFINYKNVHSNLDNGYLECTIGLAYKGFFGRMYNRKIN